MVKKEKIFLGGSYTSDKISRMRIVSYGKVIEKVIKECNYIPSLNLLTNEKIFDKTDSANGIFFENGEHFLKVGNEIMSKIKDKEIEAIRGLRDYETDNLFLISMMACNISLDQLEDSIAGIFELSELSQGSYYEIALMLSIYRRPVLALSHKDFGRKFGKMLIGQRSQFLKCLKYTDDDLADIVRKFLTIDLKEKKLEKINFKLSANMYNRLKEEAKQKGVNSSEMVRIILESHFNE